MPSQAEPGEPSGPPLSQPGAANDAQFKQNRAHAADIQAAQRVAQAWMGLMDRGKYDDSWKQFAPVVQQQITQQHACVEGEQALPDAGQIFRATIQLFRRADLGIDHTPNAAALGPDIGEHQRFGTILAVINGAVIHLSAQHSAVRPDGMKW